MNSKRKTCDRGKGKGFDKALFIVREGKEKLEEFNRHLDRERIQVLIDFKNKERDLKNRMIGLAMDQKRFAMESQSRPRSLTKKQPQQNISEKERNSMIRELRIERNLDCFPEITCTNTNVPKILRRSISSRSEKHHWPSGLPDLGKSAALIRTRLSKKPKVTKISPKEEPNNDDKQLEKKRSSRVENVVNNNPTNAPPKGDSKTKSRVQLQNKLSKVGSRSDSRLARTTTNRQQPVKSS